MPHDEPILSISFSPVKEGPLYRCVTVGADGKCKTWSSSGRRVVFMDASAKAVEQTTWAQDGTITHRSLTCKAASYSTDGSLLAIGFGGIIRLYNAISLELLGSLFPYQSIRDIDGLLIIGDYLVAVNGAGLFVWNLGTMLPVWSLHTLMHGLRLYPDADSFVVIAVDGQHHFVMTFTVHSPVPTSCFRQGGTAIVAVLPIQVERDGVVSLALLDNENNINIISNGQSIEDTSEARNKYSSRRKVIGERMADVLISNSAKPRLLMASQSRPMLRLPYVKKENLLLSDVPSHLLPPTVEAFEHFIKFKFPKFPKFPKFQV
jgi:WD40 repeat protein